MVKVIFYLMAFDKALLEGARVPLMYFCDHFIKPVPMHLQENVISGGEEAVYWVPVVLACLAAKCLLKQANLLRI